MRFKQISILLVLTVLFTGCYHASITTGLEPSNKVIDKPWAMGFVYGLIPPAEIDASTECPDGVAKVETQLSFLNQIASGLTFGLITPMHITVTCATGASAALDTDIEQDQIIAIPQNVSTTDLQQIYKYASDLAVMKDKPIYVKH